MKPYLLPLALLSLAACTPVADDDDAGHHDPVDLEFTNSGDASLEGHTPRGFQGQGTGIFAGDNINPNFPQGDGVQIFLTLDFAEAEDGVPFVDEAHAWDSIDSAWLGSDNASTSGTPFEDLGDLILDEVEFDAFSSALFDIEPVAGGHSCVFATSADGPFGCDIEPIVTAALEDGRTTAQIRLRTEIAGDSDGAQDMILFHLGNSNETARGIFHIDVSAVPAHVDAD